MIEKLDWGERKFSKFRWFNLKICHVSLLSCSPLCLQAALYGDVKRTSSPNSEHQQQFVGEHGSLNWFGLLLDGKWEGDVYLKTRGPFPRVKLYANILALGVPWCMQQKKGLLSEWVRNWIRRRGKIRNQGLLSLTPRISIIKQQFRPPILGRFDNLLESKSSIIQTGSNKIKRCEHNMKTLHALVF